MTSNEYHHRCDDLSNNGVSNDDNAAETDFDATDYENFIGKQVAIARAQNADIHLESDSDTDLSEIFEDEIETSDSDMTYESDFSATSWDKRGDLTVTLHGKGVRLNGIGKHNNSNNVFWDAIEYFGARQKTQNGFEKPSPITWPLTTLALENSS